VSNDEVLVVIHAAILQDGGTALPGRIRCACSFGTGGRRDHLPRAFPGGNSTLAMRKRQLSRRPSPGGATRLSRFIPAGETQDPRSTIVDKLRRRPGGQLLISRHMKDRGR
jgi:hypothetical protein